MNAEQVPLLIVGAGQVGLAMACEARRHGLSCRIVDQRDQAIPGLTLLNAVYFKSRWASPFDDKLTKSEFFHLSSTQQVRVSMMNKGGSYVLISRQGYRALRLPYVNASLTMVIVLPDDIDGLADVLRRVTIVRAGWTSTCRNIGSVLACFTSWQQGLAKHTQPTSVRFASGTLS